MTAIDLVDVWKTYPREGQEIPVLSGLSLQVAPGEFVTVTGPAGSGKTTLLNLIAGMDQPTRGTVRVDGTDLASLRGPALTRWRATRVGFIFPVANLIPVMTAVQNVELPLLTTGMKERERRRRAEAALGRVGLGDRLQHLPRQLSGGQEQRVAIARALVTDPPLLLADEPTTDLDRRASEDVLQLLHHLHRQIHKTVVMTANETPGPPVGRLVHLERGVRRNGGGRA